MTETYDTIKAERLKIKRVAFELDDLSRAFYLTGNTMMWKTLYDLAIIINEAEVAIGKAVSEKLYKDYEDMMLETTDVFAKKGVMKDE